MKRLKLNLDQLSEELEILDFEYLRGVKGGYGDTGGGYGGYEGNYGGYGTEDNPIQLDEVEIDGGYGGYGGNGGGGYNGGWPGWFPPAWPETGGDTGGYAPIGGGYGMGGYGDYGSWYTIDEKFQNLLDATGKTASAFEGTIHDIGSLAKIGDFAEEATNVLKSLGRYAGPVAAALNIALAAYEAFEDGNLTRDEVIDLITDEVIVSALGSIPFAGGFIATVYDLSGADDVVKAQVRQLVNSYF